MPRRDSKTSSKTVKAIDRSAEAVALRKSGHTYREIATEMGISVSRAHAAVMRAIDQCLDEIAETAPTVREVELIRLDAIIKTLWARVEMGENEAIDRVLKVMERRSRYLGLDAARKVDATLSAGHDLTKLTTPQLVAYRELVAAMQPEEINGNG